MLDDAAAAGITVLRTWAFADGEQWGALQVGGCEGCWPSASVHLCGCKVAAAVPMMQRAYSNDSASACPVRRRAPACLRSARFGRWTGWLQRRGGAACASF